MICTLFLVGILFAFDTPVEVNLRPKTRTLGRVLNVAMGPGLGPHLKKCGHRPISLIVTGFRPH